MVRNSVEARNKKKIIIKTLFRVCSTSSTRSSLVGFSNVGSSQVQQIRKLLAEEECGQLVIAKNTHFSG
jgi:ribosomal protein L10